MFFLLFLSRLFIDEYFFIKSHIWLEKLTFVRPLSNVVVFLMSAESFYAFLSTYKRKKE